MKGDITMYSDDEADELGNWDWGPDPTGQYERTPHSKNYRSFMPCEIASHKSLMQVRRIRNTFKRYGEDVTEWGSEVRVVYRRPPGNMPRVDGNPRLAQIVLNLISAMQGFSHSQHAPQTLPPEVID